MMRVILRPCPAFLYMGQVSSTPPFHQTHVLISSGCSTETFSEGDTEVRYDVSHLQHATASAAVICGRGSSNWANVSRRLDAVAHLEGRLTRALSVRLFYKVTTTAGLR